MATEINARQIEQLAREHIGKVISKADVLIYTPPLPETWPPSDSQAVVIYAYSLQPAPTGMIRYAVTSPGAAVLIEIKSDGANVRETRTMTARQLDRLQTRVRADIDVESKRAGIDAMLRALQTKQLNPETARAIQLSYRSWQREQSVICEVIAPQHPGFFTWLDEP